MTRRYFIFGNFVETGAVSQALITRVLKEASANKKLAESLHTDYIINVLHETGQLLNTKKYRAQTEKYLKENISFSDEMINATLDMLPFVLDKNELSLRLKLELGIENSLDGLAVKKDYDGFIKAKPKGVVLHVGAGNVFLGVLDSIVLGLLTKNVNIVKTSFGQIGFPLIFANALKECDRKGVLCKMLCLLEWKGGSGDIEKQAASGCDAVFVWGGEKAVTAYKGIAGLKTEVTGFGPKVSFGIVTPVGLKRKTISEIAQAAVSSAFMWDQSACSNMHSLYIVAPKNKHKELAQALLEQLKNKAQEFGAVLPLGKLSDDEKTEITKARLLAQADKAVGNGFFVSSAPKAGFTVIYSISDKFIVSPLNRTLYIKTVETFGEIAEQITPFSSYLQTVGIEGSIEEKEEFLRSCAGLKIARITSLNAMGSAPTGGPHDGIFPMQRLVNFVAFEGEEPLEDKLCGLVSLAAQKSKFYKKFYSKNKKVETVNDFCKLPYLTKEHILKNTPPENCDMFTGNETDGIYFASGGSTGAPKYIFYKQDEYAQVCQNLAVAMTSAGLSESDRAANLFVSGNLWSSWISVEKALSYTKAVSVPIGSALPVETILKYLSDFNVTAIIGLPSFLLKIAEAAKEAKTKIPLKYIFYGGEVVTPEMRDYFKSVFKNVKICSAGYATADCGTIGYQCPHCNNGEHHLMTRTHYLEIINPDTLEPVKDGHTGEIIVTVLNKKFMPVIRYRLGDLGRIITKPCACGRKDRLFEILGRCDDRMHVGGAHLFAGDLSAAIASVKGLSLNFQTVISKPRHADELKIIVETLKPETRQTRAGFAEKLEKEIYKHCEDLLYSVKNKWLCAPKIEIADPGKIERVARTGKIRKVLDLRIKI